jgi:quercetin dioxygenase-like cupin family protein
MIIIGPDGGTRYDSMGDSMRFTLNAADTGGQFTLIEDTIKPDFHAALHLHRFHSEAFYVLEGAITFILDGLKFVATPGSAIFVPAGLPHAAYSQNSGKMLTIFSPGGLEGAMAAFSQMTPAEASDPATIQRIMDTYDIVDLAQPPLEALLNFYRSLLAGDADALLALFAGEALLDTPLGGPIVGEQALRKYVAEQQTWLKERAATTRFVNIVASAEHVVVELVLVLVQDKAATELPVTLVADRSGQQISALRMYHSTWPLTGGHKVRGPLVPVPAQPLAEPAVIQAYMEALKAGDKEAILSLFSANGYVREPSGGEYTYRGPEGQAAFYTAILQAGGVVLHHCTATFDGFSFAVEYICDRWGTTDLPPQAGVAVYDLSSDGKLRAARIYDDVSPPL